MTGFQNQEGDSFKFGDNESLKLVSIDSTTTNTARKAYTSYLKEDSVKEEIKGEEIKDVQPKTRRKKTGT
ncbi:MAG: hypothetical protein KatS3mg068_1030 [Candidatus Sericytochromatia bacterium]|nr:MAG: hypothetical protein KatS3mg068_1030 [Candidatus Sericytochromatia bacterium]